MSDCAKGLVRRRAFLAGAASIGLLAATGCATLGGLSLVDVIRRLLERASANAFARLTTEDGFWNSSVARLGLPEVLGDRGGTVEGILVSSMFREQLQRRFNRVAEAGARRAAPIVAEGVRTIGTENALAILKGGPQAATALLRGQLGSGLIPAMIPELGNALRLTSDPVLSRLLPSSTGIDLAKLAQALSADVDSAIWKEIGLAEEQIRDNPESTGDAVLIAALKGL